MMSRNYSEMWGKFVAIGIVLAMLFSSGFVFTERARAEPFELTEDSSPPIPPFMIWGTIFDEINVPVLGASVTIENIRTGELLNADIYENGAYDAELESLQYDYSIGDEIKITATAGENTASKIILVKQIGFGERVDIRFGESADSSPDEKKLAFSNPAQSSTIEPNCLIDRPVLSAPEPRASENSQTIYIDSPESTAEEPEPEISLTDIRCPPYFRLAFTEKENNIRMTLKNDGSERKIIIVDLYHIEPDGITESFLRTVHFGTILPGQTKTQDAWEKCTNMWTPTQRGRNWIRGEIYIKEMTNERSFINEFKESFSIVPGSRPILNLGHTIISDYITWSNLTVILEGDLTITETGILNTPGTDVIADNVTVSGIWPINANDFLNVGAKTDGQYKVEVRPTGIFNIYGNLTNDPDTAHYWFYMNGTLNIDLYPDAERAGLVENVMGSPDLSQPGGIICTTDNVRIENGAEVRYGKTHGVWLEGSNAVIQNAKIHNNGGNGIVCRAGAEPLIEGCNISWNDKSGIDVENSNPLIQNNNSIQWNRVHGINILNIEDGDAKIEGNTINNNFGSGIWCTNANATIANNTISSNGKGLIYRENVEQDNGWASTGLWHRVCNESGQAPYYNLSNEGDWSWWYGQNTTENYDTGAANYGALTSPQMNFSTITSSSLVFWSWYETDTQGILTDHRNVTIYGESKTTVYQLHGETMKEWTRYVFDISEFVEQVITIEFSFNTNGTLDNDNQGWYVDDIEIICSYPAKEGHGVHIVGGNQIKMTGNNISMNNWNGIDVTNSVNFSIEHCEIVNNQKNGANIANIIGTANICYNLFSENYFGFYGLNSRLFIENNTFSKNWIGLRIGSVSSVPTLNNNVVSENQKGIYLQYIENTKIENNTVFQNTNIGIFIAACHNLTILNCNILNNGFDSFSLYPAGVQIGGQNFNLKICHNLFSENSGIPGIMYRNCEWDSEVSNNIFANGGVHFDLYASGNTIIFNNAFEDCGISSVYSPGSTAAHEIFNNVFFSELSGRYGGSAVGITDAPLGTIFNNTVDNYRWGLNINTSLTFGLKNIQNNLITNTEFGIQLKSTAGVTIHNNTLHNNVYSIKMTNSSAIISNNEIFSNDYGVYSEKASNSTIYHNNFINNTIQAYDDGTNQWDNGYPSGGNYWSDYAGTDAMSGPNQDIPGPDGIGDTPYTIILGGSEMQDRYPLTSAPSFGQFSIPIILGWNLISLPLIPCDTSIPTILSSIDGQWDVIKYYETTDYMDSWKTYRVNSTANDLFNLDHTMGFWLYILDAGDGFLTLEGRIPTITSIQLYTGWNLIGYPSITSRLASDTLPVQADIISIFNASSPALITDYDDLSLITMSTGNGYWVHVTGDCVWAVDW